MLPPVPGLYDGALCVPYNMSFHDNKPKSVKNNMKPD